MNRLKLLRDEFGMKQSDLGKLLNVKDSAISKYESGKIPMTGDTLIKLAEIFGVSIDYILGREVSDTEGVGTIFGYTGGDEFAISFSHKLANQIDYHGTKIDDLAKTIGVQEETIVNWLSGSDTTYSNYYEKLSDYFNVQLRYWTSPKALSPGIEPDMEEYLLILLYREYQKTGKVNELYGTLEHYFPEILFANNPDEKKVLKSYRLLNEDYQDIIIGDMKKYIREQNLGTSVAADEELMKKTGTDSLGK